MRWNILPCLELLARTLWGEQWKANGNVTEWKSTEQRKRKWISVSLFLGVTLSFRQASIIVTLLLLMTTSRNLLGWEVPSHSEDRPTRDGVCVVCRGWGQRAGFSPAVGKEHLVQSTSTAGWAELCVVRRRWWWHSPSSVVRMKDSGVLSGRGGVSLPSAAQQKIINKQRDFKRLYAFSWNDRHVFDSQG